MINDKIFYKFKDLSISKIIFSSIINPAFLVLTVYLLIFIRQYLWFTNVFFFTWVIPTFISLSLTFFIIKKLDYSKINIEFFLIVCLPLFLFYILRFAFPDASWDIINYHYIVGERGLSGYPFISGDFFYLSYANPATDMVTAVFRKLFGHRVGTIINLLVIFWTAQILEKILKVFINNKILKNLFVLLLLLFEGITYQISNYWVDLLSVPILLELVYLLCFKAKKYLFDYIIISLFLGILFSFKLTNIFAVFPLSILFFLQYLKDDKDIYYNKLFKILFLFIIFLVPIFPYHSYIYFITGNPIYPHLNWIFQSDLFLTHRNIRGTLGPQNNYEGLIWPFIMLQNNLRISNTPVYPFLTFGSYILSFIIVATSRLYSFKNKLISKSIVTFALYFIFSVFFWGYFSGDYRYVYYFEITAGILIFIICFEIFCKIKENKNFIKLYKLKYSSKILFILFFLIVIFKFNFVFDKAKKFEWAQRPTFFTHYKDYKKNLEYIFKDYNLNSFLDKESKKLFTSLEAWISSSPVVSGYMVLLNNKIPYVDLHHLPFRGTGGKNLFNSTIKHNGPLIYSSIIREGTLGLDLEWSINELRKYGFIPLSVKKFELPFFSKTDIHIKYLKIIYLIHEDYINHPKIIEKKEKFNDKSTLHVVKWKNGCSQLEKNHEGFFRWCENNFNISIKNISNVNLKLDLNLNVRSVSNEYSKLRLKSNKLEETYFINNKFTPIIKSVTLLPNETKLISFRSNAPKLEGTNDPRNLHLMIKDFIVTPKLK